jgi:hypothetical protein
MNDFKIVKCKKCDAALVELEGQKISRCNQCGYNFGAPKKSKVFESRASTSFKQDAITNQNVNNNLQAPSSFIELFKRLQDQLAKQTVQNDLQQKAPPIVSWILKLVKWYIIIAIVIVVFSAIFSD